MSSRGLSLVGFMTQLQAIAHLRHACVPANPSDAALIAEWQSAVRRLQAVNIQQVGNPNIQSIPSSVQGYIQNFVREPWVSAALQSYGGTHQFLLIEIDPLLAFQPAIDLDRADHHFRSAPSTLGTSDLLPICLPIVQPNEEAYVSPVLTGSHSVIIKSRNTGLTRTTHGIFPFNINGCLTRVAGMRFDFSLPFVYVVQFRGRYYLSNGFHRVLGARRRGATHIPCIYRTASTLEEIGIKNDGSTFTAQELDATHPPAIGHFTQGGAWDVRLRQFSRVLHVSWSDYIVPDE